MTQDPASQSFPTSHPSRATHPGVQVLGEQGLEGRKAFFIQIEARPGQEEAVVQMLQDIRACVENEPATGPWFAVRFSQAHVQGGGGDIFRDVARMNAILADAAKVHRADVLMSKDHFSHRRED